MDNSRPTTPVNKRNVSGYMTEANSEYLFRSRSPNNSRQSTPITTDARRRATIIQRIESLFPYLQEIMGKNDARS